MAEKAKRRSHYERKKKEGRSARGSEKGGQKD